MPATEETSKFPKQKFRDRRTFWRKGRGCTTSELRLGFNRVSAGVFQQNLGHSINSAIGLPDLSTNPRDLGLSLISVTGYSSLGDEYNNPQHSASNVLQLVDQVSYNRGRHLFKFGVDIRDLAGYITNDNYKSSRFMVLLIGAMKSKLASIW